MIEVKKEFLENLYDSLADMTNYADDGGLNRNDSDYKEFFESVDNARNMLEKLDSVLYRNGDK